LVPDVAIPCVFCHPDSRRLLPQPGSAPVRKDFDRSPAMTDPPKPQILTIARILRPRGNKGEVAAELLTDFPERLKALREFFLAEGKSAPRPTQLKSFWVDANHPGFAVFHFEASLPSTTPKTSRLEIQIPFEQRITLPAGKYFVTDLIGCSVFRTSFRAARSLLFVLLTRRSPVPSRLRPRCLLPGRISTWNPSPCRGHFLRRAPHPLAEDICPRIDVAARRIEVFLPRVSATRAKRSERCALENSLGSFQNGALHRPRSLHGGLANRHNAPNSTIWADDTYIVRLWGLVASQATMKGTRAVKSAVLKRTQRVFLARIVYIRLPGSRRPWGRRLRCGGRQRQSADRCLQREG